METIYGDIQETEIVFRPATRSDLVGVMLVYAEAKRYMRQQGFVQWTEQYPTPEHVRQDTTSAYLYVAEAAGRIVGAGAVCPGPEPAYAWISGSWHSSGLYAVVHRFAVAADFRGSGLSSRLMDYLLKRALEKTFSIIRIDTHPRNRAMKSFLKRYGFRYCGICFLENGMPVHAFDLDLFEEVGSA